MDKISSAEPDKVSSALSFSVEFEDEPKKAKRKPPKHLLDRHNKRKEVSQESIDEKQRKADDRRKKHIEDRLERIRQLEEEAMSLARAMQPMLDASVKTTEQDTPNGVQNPTSVRRRCAEDDPVNVRVMVNNTTENVISELKTIDTTNSISQNGI